VNVLIDVSTMFPSLSIAAIRPSLWWDLEEKGFAFRVHADGPFEFYFSFMRVTRASDSAVQIDGGEIVLFNVYLTALQFSECKAVEGPALFANFSGQMILDDVSVSDCHASSQCGGVSIYARGLSVTSVRFGSSLSFVSTHSEGPGGCMCLFMAPSAGFLALYTPNNVGMISATACTSGGEGLIYIDGGSVTMSNIFAKSNRALSGGFVSAKNLQMFKVNSGVVQNTTVTEDGSAFATYNSNEVNITGVSISTCKSGGSGTIYLEGGRRGYLSELTMNSNNVNQYGGAIFINGTEEITLAKSSFSSNIASKGAAVGCVGGSDNTTVVNVSMKYGWSTSGTFPADVWSDGTCSSSFWYPPTDCVNDTCTSCSGDVCSQTLTCQCYCTGSPDYPCASPSSTPTPSRTPTASFSPSVSFSPSASPIGGSGGPELGMWVYIVLCILGCVVLAGLAYGVYFWHKNRGRNLFPVPYQDIN